MDSAIYYDKDLNLYEIVKSYDNTSVLYSFRDSRYCAVSKLRLDNEHLEWRSLYPAASLNEAKTTAKEINNLYDKIAKNRTVRSTADDIDDNIQKSSKELYHYDLDEAYMKTSENHSEFDIALTTALTINNYSYDGRISSSNKKWAAEFLSANDINCADYKQFYGCNTHLAIFDGFTNTVRQNIANRTISQLKGENYTEEEAASLSIGRK